MRLLVIEDGLRGSDGHYLNNCLAIKQAAESRGIETKFIIHRQAELSVVNQLSAIPCITFNQFDRVSVDPLCGNVESHIIQRDETAKNLMPILEQQIDQNFILFYPTASFNQLAALGELFERSPKLRFAKYIFNFVIQDFLLHDGVKFNQNASFYRMAANKIRRKISRQQILLTANGSRMTSTVSSILNTHVEQYPMPKHYPDALIYHKKSIIKSTRPLVGVLGSMYGPQKGLHLIPRLVENNPGLDWLIQEPSLKNRRLWGPEEKLIRSKNNVKLIEHGLPAENYYQNFNSVDIVLTPYMLRNDQIQTSGIVSEAAASGKIIVSPANPWIQEHIDSGSVVGCTFNEWTIESIEKSIKRAVEDLNSLKIKAADVAEQWRKRQNVDAYLSKALNYFGNSKGIKDE